MFIRCHSSLTSTVKGGHFILPLPRRSSGQFEKHGWLSFHTAAKFAIPCIILSNFSSKKPQVTISVTLALQSDQRMHGFAKFAAVWLFRASFIDTARSSFKKNLHQGKPTSVMLFDNPSDAGWDAGEQGDGNQSLAGHAHDLEGAPLGCQGAGDGG